MTIGVVVGMRSEAALLRGRPMIGCSGGRPEKAAQIADYMLKAGASGLISFGIGGGLAPALRPGDLVIGKSVDLGGASLATDSAWAMHLANQLPDAVQGVICGASVAAVTAADKAALHAESGALLIDLESAAVAEVAAAAGKPFAVLRAVADPARRAIPDYALKALDANGGTRISPVLLGLMMKPYSLPALLRLAGDSRKALNALSAAARFLGPSLGF